jgi:hypothetical protein
MKAAGSAVRKRESPARGQGQEMILSPLLVAARMIGCKRFRYTAHARKEMGIALRERMPERGAPMGAFVRIRVLPV